MALEFFPRGARAAALALPALLCLACDTGRGDYLDTGTLPDPSGYTLVWSDEFNGAGVDGTKWTPETGGGGWGNNEAEVYTGNAANLGIIADGAVSALRITARQDSPGSFSSARIKTQGRFSFKYGKAEARIKLPKGRGMWPAFWMLGDSISSLGWPRCGEIDILEMRGGIADGVIGSTLHWGADWQHHEYVGIERPALANGAAFADDYHVFTMEWDASDFRFYLDGSLYYTQAITTSGYADMSAFTTGNFFFILNLAVGGNYISNQLPNSSFISQDMLVDWIRVYQK
jgi:beta-glucanase (GH16 family)